MIRETARAKINLDLHVLGRRPDGRHDLDSITVFTALGDDMTFEPAADYRLQIDGPFAPSLSPGAENLVTRAALALAASVSRAPAVRIGLLKHLPVASGIGGGSADAAATLRGLQALWGVEAPALHDLAQGLGADVPVCLSQRPARMEGAGERLTPIAAPSLPIVLANPGLGVATGRVFAARRPAEGGPRPQATPPPDDAAGFVRWLQAGRNDLAAPAIRLAPAIADVLTEIQELPGCALARMSGSGATCFGLFPTPRAASAAAMRLATRHPEWWVQATRTLAE
ncbi:4-diphosphocytidyl-2-C-methyl-D-erythritol kinase [Arboricoccus pini]|uniref:4-diphosphocytidyl-2-C-methyl-D-erythritol kinase n=1 Tax=Arboricoccus pini TaxID=1963835 RepID=A0A212PY94_9PROT|nr:4-(cytidine 5'-diphospho)-2-C-methyl-D-erythritol kinase [Arboricoccus pini]SNB51959.1 4-diphosphocytidyl-2-C-methyl-D-erythritol kinase [Arboricoccus pini]